ncbi:MAG TPA: DUF4199 domain-containing protein, partial [Chitinophagaceae bacterium]|nr:DUF4199 domain-containing protein [Chitinophagaceae bacterium]
MQTTSTITKGLIISLIMIACALGTYFAGMDFDSPLRWLTYCIYIIGVIVSILQYGKQIDHNATFGNYFAHGFKISATVTVIMIVYIVIFINLFPEFKEKALDEAKKAMDARQNTSDEQKVQAVEMTKKLFMVFLVGGTLIYNIILGAVASLIGAAVAKKNPRPLEEIN